ncbi:hypothetical protein N9H39_06545 [Gammaproteobacteria bacterium]|nr:hypothetical protein [Gammaproteobacteria bacterium]
MIEQVQVHLYAGELDKAASQAQERLIVFPQDDQARFTLGAIQFLRAIEQLGQELYRYGLRTIYRDRTGMGALPIMRIPVPENPDPEEITYSALREIFQHLISNLETSESTLSEISSNEVDLPLNIGRISLDLDSDGIASERETLWHMYKQVVNAGWLNPEEASALLADFDVSDVSWLRAYCHLLMAVAEFSLAHDWQETFEATFQAFFPTVNPEFQSLIKNNLYDDLGDLIAFVHLLHWPVVEPQRMRSTLAHLESMVSLSRESWNEIMAETDNRNEWIPNPQQMSVLPGMSVTEIQVSAWQQFLNEFDALLQGEKLLPHWRFRQGINLRRFFIEPKTFDLVLMIQGYSAVPYLEDGVFTTGDTWLQIITMFGGFGGFITYFVWFN